jgi:multisubunit Na+/H+ antiporter MnhB subunit
MNAKLLLFLACLLVISGFFMFVFLNPGFNSWDNKKVSGYYIKNMVKDIGAASEVSSITWDYRGFDTLGEETVLFTAAVGVLTIVTIGLRKGA